MILKLLLLASLSVLTLPTPSVKLQPSSIVPYQCLHRLNHIPLSHHHLLQHHHQPRHLPQLLLLHLLPNPIIHLRGCAHYQLPQKSLTDFRGWDQIPKPFPLIDQLSHTSNLWIPPSAPMYQQRRHQAYLVRFVLALLISALILAVCIHAPVLLPNS